MDEKVFEQTRNFWGDTVRRGNLLYPNDKVIRFMKRNFKNPSKTTVLDFGCGGGRNSLALACEGYRVIAMDYTDTAIEMTTAKLHGMGNVSIMQNKGLDIPLEDSSVDAIVADGSLFCNNLTNTAKLLGNLKKTLKPGGLMWADFRSTEDSLYQGGYQLDDFYFMLDDRTDRNGVAYLFVNEEVLRELYKKVGFTIVALEEYMFTDNNRSIKNSWFHVTASR